MHVDAEMEQKQKKPKRAKWHDAKFPAKREVISSWVSNLKVGLYLSMDSQCWALSAQCSSDHWYISSKPVSIKSKKYKKFNKREELPIYIMLQRYAEELSIVVLLLKFGKKMRIFHDVISHWQVLLCYISTHLQNKIINMYISEMKQSITAWCGCSQACRGLGLRPTLRQL